MNPIPVIFVHNPFEPLRNLQREFASEGQTIREFLAEIYGSEFVEFDKPTVCKINGEFVMREAWELPLNDGDNVLFVTMPENPVAIVIAVVALVVAIVAYFLIPDPKIPKDSTNSSASSYTLRGQVNQYKPNEPIEVVYGKCRRWPTFISRPYSRYIGNQQYQYSLFCVGQGDYDISDLQLDDTPLSKFEEIEIQICPPGVNVTLVESSVSTATEVSNIELLAPNQPDYIGFSGPYILNDFDKPIHRIAVDVSFPQGLYKINSRGKLENLSVDLLFEYQEVNQFEVGVGPWRTLQNVRITRKDNTPQRKTYSKQVSAGRYHIRGRRKTNKSTSTSEVSQVRWESAKAYAQDIGNFGDVTVIAMKALATNNLNDSTSRSFNGIFTRKLRFWQSPLLSWGASVPVATRNPVWAFCDLFMSNYGAKLSDEFLDMPNLKILADYCDANSKHFDWIFDSRMSVWEAAGMILRVARAVPIPQGSLITAIRDKPQTLPSAIFNQHNIVKGSLSKNLNMFDFQPFDALIVEYTDPKTWKTREVKCTLPGRVGNNPDRIKLPGCTDRDRAYQEGLYIQAGRELRRKIVTFQTGLEGHLPSYLDLVAITNDTVRIGQGGVILAYNTGTRVMTLSDTVNFASPSIVHKIAIRSDNGGLIGTPINCLPGANPNQVILEIQPPALNFSENRMGQLYAFGVSELWSFMGKVTSIKPIDEKTVELTLTNYVSEAYSYDSDATVAAVVRDVILDKSDPEIEWVTITPVPARIDSVFVDWLPSPGASSYLMESSYDLGASWNAAGNFASPPVKLPVNFATLNVRVAPYAVSGNVIWKESAGFIVGSNIIGPPAVIFEENTAYDNSIRPTVFWKPVTGAKGYSVSIMVDVQAGYVRTVDTAGELNYSYDYSFFVQDMGPLAESRFVKFDVIAYNEAAESIISTKTITNPLPPAAIPTITTENWVDFTVSWAMPYPEPDLKEYRVYIYSIQGTVPNLFWVPEYAGPDQSFTFNRPINDTFPNYIKVMTMDVWTSEMVESAELQRPWSPRDYPVFMWLDGNDPATLLTAAGGVPVAPDQPVGYWKNKAKIDNTGDAFQTNLAAQPIRKLNLKNGRGGLRFNGTNQTMMHNLSLPQAGTVFIVMKSLETASNSKTIFQVSGPNTNLVQCLREDPPSNTVSTFRSQGVLYSGQSIRNNYSLVILTCDTPTGVSGSFKINNITTPFTGNGFYSDLTDMRSIASNGSGNKFINCDICEIIVTGTALPAEEFLKFESYLKQKWDIA